MGIEIVYPPAYNDTYIKTTSFLGEYNTEYAFDPALPLTGAAKYNSWLSATSSGGQKINVDYGTAFILAKITIDNYHNSGGDPELGCKNVVVYGTNSVTAFENTVYTDVTDLTELGSFLLTQHIAADTADPQVQSFSTSLSFRYYVFRFADNYGGVRLGIRHFEFSALMPEPITIDGSIGFSGTVGYLPSIVIQGAIGFSGSTTIHDRNDFTIKGGIGFAGALEAFANNPIAIDGALRFSGTVDAFSANQDMEISGGVGFYGLVTMVSAKEPCSLPAFNSGRWS